MSADSHSAMSDHAYRFTGEAAHPGVVVRFRQTLDRVSNLPCDILLTPHPSASRMWARLGRAAAEPLADPSACRTYAAALDGLEPRLAEEPAAPHHKAAP